MAKLKYLTRVYDGLYKYEAFYFERYGVYWHVWTGSEPLAKLRRVKDCEKWLEENVIEAQDPIV